MRDEMNLKKNGEWTQVSESESWWVGDRGGRLPLALMARWRCKEEGVVEWEWEWGCEGGWEWLNESEGLRGVAKRDWN